MFGIMVSCVVLFLATLFIYEYLQYIYTYWERRRVPFVAPRMILGNTQNPFTRKISYGIELKMLYDELKSRGAKHAGLYSFCSPIYFPIDLDIIKTILTKDFNSFMNRGRYHDEQIDPITAHLFNIEGEKWRRLRIKFSPTFTSNKIKLMYPILLECGKALKNALEHACNSRKPVEVRDLADKFTIDVIGSCAFGIECNSFSNPDSEFAKHGSLIFASSLAETARLLVVYSFPKLSKFLKIRRHDKSVNDFFTSLVKNTIDYRTSNGVRRSDFLQSLIDLKNSVDVNVENSEENLTIQELAAQTMIFFAAGFETSAATISFCLYELARHPEVQQRVREEIRDVVSAHGGKLSFEALHEMKYLQQVLDETLRKYPPLPLLNRQCLHNYTFEKDNITLEEGTKVIISLMGLHHDPEHFPDPEKFDPERFSPENRKNIHPFSYLPFGEGPRNCIGLRFGLTQTKTALCLFLEAYSFSVNSRTAVPLEMKLAITSGAKGGVWLDVTKLR